MSNPAVDIDGDLILVGQQGTIQGAVTSDSASPGFGVNSSVTFVTILGDTFTCKAGDLDTPDDPQIPANPGRTADGNAFALNDQAVVNGKIIAVTNGPWGITGQVTVLTDFSLTSVTVFSGAVQVNG